MHGSCGYLKMCGRTMVAALQFITKLKTILKTMYKTFDGSREADLDSDFCQPFCFTRTVFAFWK